MKRLIFKTALLTIGVTLILAIAVFGITSFFAPRAMMDLTASLGMTGISGDYAYQEYERTGDLSCLARAFVISADRGEYRIAEERFTILYEDEAERFGTFCTEQGDLTLENDAGETVVSVSYRAYLCGLGAVVKYRAARSDEALTAAYQFAFSETDAAFPSGNPTFSLAIEAVGEEDGGFCAALLNAMQGAGFEENALYSDVVRLLEEVIHE